MSDELTTVEPDPQRDHHIYQCLVSGLAPYDVAVHFGVPLEYVLPIQSELPEFMRKRTTPPALRKELALARTDMAMRALLPAVEKGDREAIDLMLKVQKREAAMTGLDAPVKSDVNQTIRIDAPWMSPNRLSYRHNIIDMVPASVEQRAEQEAKQLDDAAARHALRPERQPEALPLLRAADVLKPDPRTVGNPSGPNATPKRSG